MSFYIWWLIYRNRCKPFNRIHKVLVFRIQQTAQNLYVKNWKHSTIFFKIQMFASNASKAKWLQAIILFIFYYLNICFQTQVLLWLLWIYLLNYFTLAYLFVNLIHILYSIFIILWDTFLFQMFDRTIKCSIASDNGRTKDFIKRYNSMVTLYLIVDYWSALYNTNLLELIIQYFPVFFFCIE